MLSCHLPCRPVGRAGCRSRGRDCMKRASSGSPSESAMWTGKNARRGRRSQAIAGRDVPVAGVSAPLGGETSTRNRRGVAGRGQSRRQLRPRFMTFLGSYEPDLRRERKRVGREAHSCGVDVRRERGVAVPLPTPPIIFLNIAESQYPSSQSNARADRRATSECATRGDAAKVRRRVCPRSSRRSHPGGTACRSHRRCSRWYRSNRKG